MDRPTVVIDTREQLPLAFDPERTHAVHKALPAGDYSLEGWEERVAVERKTLEDFVSTATRGRKRFFRELRRLQAYEAACIVVEAGLGDLLLGKYRSDAHPVSMFGTVLSIVVDFGIPVFFCTDRQVALRFIEGYLLRFHRKVSGT